MTKHIAHITIEADTPLKVGSNASDFLQDSPIQKDWNNLPMILGASIAGVLRKDFDKSKVDDIFGDEDSKKKDAKGSKVIFSNALLLDEKKKVCEELLLESKKSDFLKIFDNLPIREHTRINDKGVTGSSKEFSKFDEEVVYKGSRFKFSIEMIGDGKESFENILNLLSSPSFRLGGGSTKGFGKFKIRKIKTQTFIGDDYKNYSSSLNHTLTTLYNAKSIDANYTIYNLKIKPDDFFMFGSGFGDSDADMTPVYEKVIDYEKGCLSEEMILIPASGIKGALSHRTTFHYNKLQGNTIEDGNGIEVVKEIFGEAKNSKEKIDGSKGKILISDCFKKKITTKVFDHVSIDRFTGGAIDGALFQEKTIAKNAEDDWYEIEILLEKDIDEVYVKAFEDALSDIRSGMLALGGATTKGHGVFSGSWSKI